MEFKLDGHYGYRGLMLSSLPLFGMDAIWFSACVAEVLALILGAFLLVRHRGRYGY